MAIDERLPTMPIRDCVVFPQMVAPFVVGRKSSVLALQEALAGDKRVFLAAQRDASVVEPQPREIFSVGTIVKIVQSLKLPDGNIKMMVEGVERAKVVSVSAADGFFLATVRTSSDRVERSPQLDALVSRVTRLLGRYLKLSQKGPTLEQALQAVPADDPGKLADTVGANLPLTLEEKQGLLEVFDPIDRLTRVAEILNTKIGEMKTMDGTLELKLLRHTVATLAYRASKAVRGAPLEFAAYRSARDSRTPAEILAHMGDLFDWALLMCDGRQEWHNSPALPWDEGVARFFAALEAFDRRLDSGVPLGIPAEKLFQGPIADALTHVGQIAMLRRLAGCKVRGENYVVAKITVGQTGVDQAEAVFAFD